MWTPSLSPLKEATIEQSASKRRIITDLQAPGQHADRERMRDIQQQSLDTLGDIPSDHQVHTYASQGVLPTGPQEDPALAKLTAAQRGARALEGSPMFAPLEVKFKNLSKFEESAKKNMSGAKYPTIDVTPDDERRDKRELEGDPALLPQTLHGNPSTQSMH